MSKRAKSERFDSKYYDRFYRSAATRVSDAKAVTKLGRFVCSYVDYLGIPVEGPYKPEYYRY